MLVATSCDMPPNPVSSYSVFDQNASESDDWRQPVDWDTTRDSFSEVEIGPTRYRLKHRLVGTYVNREDEGSLFIVEAFPGIEGMGGSRDDARGNWNDRIHATFQRLYRKRPFQRSPEEQLEWSRFLDHFDVAWYSHTTPIESREIGRVSKHRSGYPEAIQWIDGREDKVLLAEMPDEFASYQAGQWLEAITARDRETQRLVKVVSCSRMPSQVNRLSGEALEEYWNSLPTTQSYPEVDI